MNKLVCFLALILSCGSFGGAAPHSQEEEKKKSEKASSKEKVEGQRTYVVVVEDSESFIPSLNVVTTKLPVPLLATPSTVDVVTEALFDYRDAQVVGDALSNVSGVAVHTGFGVHDFFTIRGFDSLSSALVLADGAREPEATFYHLYNVDRVEVLKGPGAFLYGANPLSGSVNLVRKKPLFTDFFNGRLEGGSFYTGRAEIDYNESNDAGTAALRVNAFGRRSAGFRDTQRNWQTGINPTAAFRLGNSGLLSFDFEYVRNEFKSDTGIPLVNNQLPEIPRERSFQTPFDFSDQDLFRFRSDLNFRLNDRVTLRNKFYLTDLDWLSNGTLISGTFPNPQGGFDVFRNLLQLDDHQRVIGNQFEAIFTFSSWGLRHQLLSGFEAFRSTDDFTLDVAFINPISLFNPIETASPPFFSIPSLAEAGDTRALVFAPYIVDQITLSETIQVFAGGRVDFLDFEDDLNPTSREDTEFSPFAGVVLKPESDLSIFAMFGRAFAPPSTRVVGEREPERSQQFEVGLKKQFYSDRILAGISFFHLEKENIAIPDETGITRQTGDQRSRGVEMKLQGELGEGWSVFGTYSFIDAELTEFREQIIVSLDPFSSLILDRSGNRPPFAPQNIFSLSVIKRFVEGLSLGGSARFVDEQFIAENNAFAIDDYFRLDATVAYDFLHWRLFATFKNITDTEYNTRGFGSSSVIPADPFALSVGIEFRK